MIGLGLIGFDYATPDPDLQEADRLTKTGNALYQQGRFADAEALHRRALALTEQALGPDHPLTATNLNNLGEALRKQGCSR